MIEIGYKLCSEEHGPDELVGYAMRAEEVGFDFAMISDHYHPWTDAQGQSPFVWNVIGGAAQVTDRLRIGTGVTCPTIRIHPAIIAQAAATSAAMMPGRFMLGLGAGENLNEHILGERWPPADVRLAMLEEAVGIIRLLWEGGQQSFYGNYYTVENAQLYTLPERPPEVLIAAGGAKSAQVAGRIGDGYMGTGPDRETIQKFKESGGEGKPCYGEIAVCWAAEEAEARRTAFERWPIVALKGELTAELPVPAHFEQAAQMVTEDDVAEVVVCGPDARRYAERVREYEEAGYDHVWFHQIGPDQEGFFNFFEKELKPSLKGNR
ncbi:MAG TPA: TIGR03557 family F420-dependent LLM class oxidoreductase [Blastocatellia bacterium]|nr:TIGR03557 family F420-dependent LLM class oxidoreductase [Blastocatellia bacterium]